MEYTFLEEYYNQVDLLSTADKEKHETSISRKITIEELI